MTERKITYRIIEEVNNVVDTVGNSIQKVTLSAIDIIIMYKIETTIKRTCTTFGCDTYREIKLGLQGISESKQKL